MVMWGVWETGGNVGVWEFRSRISSVVISQDGKVGTLRLG